MRPHRLSRLTFLTQGIALVGFGMTQAGCPNEQPIINGPPDYHINAPPTTPPADAAGTPTPSVSPSSAWNDQADAATPIGSQRPIMNAMPPDAAAPMGSQRPNMNAPPHVAPPPPPPMPPHTNAPPKM